MKKKIRIISAVLSTAIFASVVTVAPISARAVEKKQDIFESNIDFTEKTYAHSDSQEPTHYFNMKTITVSSNDQKAEVVGSIEEFEYGDYKYTLSNGNVTITKYTGTEENLVIPSSINDNSVTSIGFRAFGSNPYMKTLLLPTYLNSIARNSFENCTNLESVSIPKNLKTVITSYDSEGVLEGCTNLKTVTFEEGTEEIPDCLFRRCTGLETVVMPDSVKKIGFLSFGNCTSLKSIKLSANLEEMVNSQMCSLISLTFEFYFDII